jgi:phosphoribosyl 1,2-cyclic phosphodiesterase
MKVRFWGTRGSIPVALTSDGIRGKLIAALSEARGKPLESPAAIEDFVDRLPFSMRGTYGGHSSCLEIERGNEAASNSHVLFDFGSGARALGQAMLARHGTAAQTYHVFMSHLHWDHIMGFPFFAPAYIPGNRIVIHSGHAEVAQAFAGQQEHPGFPVGFDHMGAQIEFDVIEPGRRIAIADFHVTAKKQRHGGDSYGWRLECDDRVCVYSTDSEHRLEDIDERLAFGEFFAGADLVVFDSMYSLADAISVKADWGHSSNIVGVELCQLAGARRLALFHHEPASDDAQIDRVLAETRRFEMLTRESDALEIFSAYDGLVIEL